MIEPGWMQSQEILLVQAVDVTWRGNCSWENGTLRRDVVARLHRASWAGCESREIPPLPRARLSSGSDILCKLVTH